jgi:long-chain acyl-CoA synthetase
MVAPLRLEELLKAATPLVEDVCVVGTGRKYIAALIQPSYDALLAWARRSGIPWAEQDLVRRADPTGEVRAYGVVETWLHLPQVRAVFEEAIAGLNGRLADFERIRRFDLVPQAFTMDRGEITPTLKKRRRRILENHAERVEALFN